MQTDCRRAGTEAPSVSVVICAYTEERWDALVEAVASMARQTLAPAETIVVVDHNRALHERASGAFPHVRVLESDGDPGLSSARNTGVRVARGEVVAFLDDDAVADSVWLEELARPYRDPRVIGCGGVASPDWSPGEAPRWLPREFYWTIGCSYRGLPDRCEAIRNPIGASMSFRRDVLERIDGFATGIGRLGTTPLGCEETELSIRARRAHAQGVVLHVPAARVLHRVPAERASWRYFRARCWAEGRSKALVTGRVGAEDGLSVERAYALRTLPTGVVRGLADTLRGDASGVLRSGAIIAGLAITAAGYLRGRLAPGG
jgi:GT2 family glycosyltransferase